MPQNSFPVLFTSGTPLSHANSLSSSLLLLSLSSLFSLHQLNPPLCLYQVPRLSLALSLARILALSRSFIRTLPTLIPALSASDTPLLLVHARACSLYVLPCVLCSLSAYALTFALSRSLSLSFSLSDQRLNVQAAIVWTTCTCPPAPTSMPVVCVYPPHTPNTSAHANDDRKTRDTHMRAGGTPICTLRTAAVRIAAVAVCFSMLQCVALSVYCSVVRGTHRVGLFLLQLLQQAVLGLMSSVG